MLELVQVLVSLGIAEADHLGDELVAQVLSQLEKF